MDNTHKKLYKNKQVVKLGDKAFKLLALLVEESPHTVSKQTVMEVVWKGRIVTENTLYKTIGRIRKELEDAGLVIESVFSEGYRITDEINLIHSETTQNKEKISNKGLNKVVTLMLIAFVFVMTFILYNSIYSKKDLAKTILEMSKAMSATKTAFISQIKRRNELGEMLADRFELDPNLSWERRFYKYHEQMNKEELFVFDQIRAFTDGPMLKNNKLILELIDQDNKILEAIPSSGKLRNHLIIWINKYQKVFKDSKQMCLLYVGVEDGVPYPSEVDQQVIDWLQKNKDNEKNND